MFGQTGKLTGVVSCVHEMVERAVAASSSSWFSNLRFALKTNWHSLLEPLAIAFPLFMSLEEMENLSWLILLSLTLFTLFWSWQGNVDNRLFHSCDLKPNTESF